jgi:hypothetical protein
MYKEVTIARNTLTVPSLARHALKIPLING